jgi:hypothetical protein
MPPRPPFVPVDRKTVHEVGHNEPLWGYLRANVTRGVFWGTIARQCQAACDFLSDLDLATFQRLMSSSPCLRTS